MELGAFADVMELGAFADVMELGAFAETAGIMVLTEVISRAGGDFSSTVAAFA
jgi:hypothetical protein